MPDSQPSTKMANANPSSTTAAKNSIPDLYHLLDIQPLEDDLEIVRQAIQRAKSAADALPATSAARKKKLLRVCELSTHNLLNPKRRDAYERLWKSTHAASQTTSALTSSAASEDWNYAAMNGLLPCGDPDRAFDMSEFLAQTSEDSTTEPEVEFNRLKSLLSGAPLDPPTMPKSDLASKFEPKIAPQTSEPPKIKLASAGKLKNGKPRSLAKDIRRKKDNSLLLMLSGALVSIAVVLAVLFYALRPPAEESGEFALNDQPDSPALVGGSNAPLKPRSGGLPKVSGLGDSSLNTPANFGMQSPNSPMSQAAEDSAPSPENGESGNDAAPNSSAATETGMNSNASQMGDETQTGEPVTNISAMNNTSGMNMGSMEGIAEGMAETASPASIPELTAEQKEDWKTRLTEVRKVLGQQNYPEAEKLLIEAETLAQTPIQITQLQRLKITGEFAKQFHSALIASIESLDAGQTFKVQSTDVAFVGGNSEKVTIRMRGQNQTFELTKILPGLAYAIADLQLDQVHRSTLAKKAAFTLLHPNNNALVLGRARKMMAEAEDAGIVPPGTSTVFVDDYSFD